MVYIAYTAAATEYCYHQTNNVPDTPTSSMVSKAAEYRAHKHRPHDGDQKGLGVRRSLLRCERERKGDRLRFSAVSLSTCSWAGRLGHMMFAARGSFWWLEFFLEELTACEREGISGREGWFKQVIKTHTWPSVHIMSAACQITTTLTIVYVHQGSNITHISF